MRRLALFALLSGFAVAVACKTAADDCSGDPDCGNGAFCNDDGQCQAIDTSEGGTPSVEGGGQCLAPTSTCATDTECCTGKCSRGRCASGTGTSSSASSSGTTTSSSTSSSGSSCKDLYAPCVSGIECCSNACESGVCR